MSLLTQDNIDGCFFCNSTTQLHPCDYCENIQSCEKHLHIHRPSNTCLPFRILFQEGVGRCVVAARDILAGEMVIEDKAAMIGPACRERVCLECLAPISEETRCHICGLPLCCEGPRHHLECQIMKGWKVGSNLSLYLAVCIIRGLAADGDTQELVDGLMDHLDERRLDDGEDDWDWKNVECHVIDQLLECGVDHSKLAMERIAGIFLTNNVSCAALKGGEENGFGLFPIFSILSHSCLANTRRCVEGEKMKVRATIPIKKGQEILTSYTYPELGSVVRTTQFRTTWYFDCACERCADPTELGTFLSCLKCAGCEGCILPAESLVSDSDWVCGGCGHSIAGEEAMERNLKIKIKCDECKENIEDMENLIPELLKFCHPNHYLIMQIKKNLALMYGNTENTSMTNLTDKQLARKVSLCQEWMEVLGKVDRGFTLTRGVLLEEVAKSKLENIKRNDMTKIQLLMEMKGVMKLVKEVGKCKQFESEEEQKQFARRAKGMILN
eukprot:GFUD01003281.1.p1 GENE.GFUD01003281.1~~GFUD01003281.1.p1  ORF type:complete len:499 (+),score=130.58 GFUD01003281.1:101-1597(+)